MKSEGMIFEKVVADDLDELAGLQPEGWTEIRSKFQFYIENEFCVPYKMTINREIVGLGSTIVFGETAWLAHIIVGSKFRNRGIGFKIVENLLNSLKSNSEIKSVLLMATEMGEPIYKKAGFRFISEYLFLKREKPWIETPISKNIIPYNNDFYKKLIQLDRKISGENREVLIRQFLYNASVYVKNKELFGFYLPDLGDGILFADNDEAGIELMKLKYSKVDRAVLPEDNVIGIDFLKKCGFGTPGLENKRMILGEDLNWAPENYFSRIGGNFG